MNTPMTPMAWNGDPLIPLEALLGGAPARPGNTVTHATNPRLCAKVNHARGRSTTGCRFATEKSFARLHGMLAGPHFTYCR